MELSRAVATGALILAVLLVVGHAKGGDEDAAIAKEAKETETLQPKESETLQQKLEKREEEARRAAVLEQQRRAEIFERHCRKPVKTAEELETCRAVYRQM
jgi:hypothetical protein